MKYDSVKRGFSRWIRRSSLMRRLFYSAMGVLFLREWYVKKAIRGLQFLRAEECEILDAGAGFGQYSYYCMRRFTGAKVLGLDINEEHMADGNHFARKIGLDRLSFRKEDITKIGFQGRFDLILNVDVLEHVEQDQLLLNHFCKALKPGGVLILSTPTIYRSHRIDSTFVDEHFRDGYSEEEITLKLKKAGFHIIRMDYGYGIWGDISWRFGIRNTMKLMGLKKFGKVLAPLYLILVLPFVLVLMILDYFWENRKGTGFIIQALKPVSVS